MKSFFVNTVLFLLLTGSCYAQNLVTAKVRNIYSNVVFSYQKISGIGFQKGVTRRDPSDVIKVGKTWYIFYTKVYGRTAGYWGTIWYATSKDNGYHWKERGEVLGPGKKGTFDSQAVFTPNILYANRKFYLYYTGVRPTPGNRQGKFENNSSTDITAIGVAVADSLKGPFKRICKDPILKVSLQPGKFDSYRVDDSALLYRNGLYWLYYKGRSRKYGSHGAFHTEMGVAFSKNPIGPFIKYGKPLLKGSHEVLIWQQGTGVGALASLSHTLAYAPDGIHFRMLDIPIKNLPQAPGLYRRDLTNNMIYGQGFGISTNWGISQVSMGNEVHLVRFEVKIK